MHAQIPVEWKSSFNKYPYSTPTWSRYIYRADIPAQMLLKDGVVKNHEKQEWFMAGLLAL